MGLRWIAKLASSEGIDGRTFGAVASGVSEPLPVMSGAVAAEKLVLKSDVEIVPVLLEEMKAEQLKDPVVSPVCLAVLIQNRPDRKAWSEWSQGSKVLMRSVKKLKIENGCYYVKRQSFVRSCCHKITTSSFFKNYMKRWDIWEVIRFVTWLNAGFTGQKCIRT